MDRPSKQSHEFTWDYQLDESLKVLNYSIFPQRDTLFLQHLAWYCNKKIEKNIVERKTFSVASISHRLANEAMLKGLKIHVQLPLKAMTSV